MSDQSRYPHEIHPHRPLSRSSSPSRPQPSHHHYHNHDHHRSPSLSPAPTQPHSYQQTPHDQRHLSRGPSSPTLRVPPTLPRLIFKTQHLPVDALSSHSRQTSGTATAYSTLRSGSTSLHDYLSNALGHHQHQRQRSYSGGTSEGAASELGSEASFRLASSGDIPVEGQGVAVGEETRGYGEGIMWREGHMSRSTSGGMLAGTVLPSLPRTIKAVTGPTSAAETPVRAKNGGGGSNGLTSKSRKSSCDLCHHRKIRCDQGRPACGSCARKGHICNYSDDTNRPGSRVITPTARSITVVSANNPSEKTIMTVPTPLARSEATPAPRSAHPGAAVGRGGPEWNAVRSGLPTPTPTAGINATSPVDAFRPTSAMGNNGNGSGSAGGSGGKAKKNQRERILNGFDSDSEEDRVRSGQGIGTSKGVKQEGKASVEEELVELAAVKAEEVDELESEEERERFGGRASAEPSVAASGISGAGSGKRASGDEELNGELLELTSGPPKKTKLRQSAPAASANLTVRGMNNPYRPPSRNGMANGLGNSRRNGPAHSSLTATTPLTTSSSDPYTSSIQALMASLPSNDIQRILFDTFFVDPFLNEGITLLQPQFYEDLKSLTDRRGQKAREGDAITLANAFAMLATALRILPDETSRLLLASSAPGTQGPNQPKSLSRLLSPQLVLHPDPTPLDQRYFDLALFSSHLSESGDSPSVMLVMLKLILYRFMAIKKEKNVIAGQYLGGAIRVAQALGMGKEWEGIPQGERELRRRVMWCLYIADRHYSFDTAFPYTILDVHQGIHLPSPISEADLYKIAKDAQSLPPHSTEVGPTACTALFIHTHLARRITPILDSFATISSSHTPHDLVLRFDQSLDNFQDALPPYMRLFPGTDTRFDGAHPYLASHRIRLHATLLAYRQGVHRSFIPTYLRPSAPSGIRGVMASICLSSLRTQRSAKMLDPKVAPRIFEPLVVFESAMILGLILHVEKAVLGKSPMVAGAEGLMWREGVANGMEMMDNVSAASGGGEMARKGVKLLREMCSRVDAPIPELDGLGANGHQQDENGQNTTASSDTPNTRSSVRLVDSWLDGLAQERRTLEVLLRDPQWESAWERILAGM